MPVTVSPIEGVCFLRPKLNPDKRGSLDVIFNDRWPGVPAISQWNLVRSLGGVLRGMHAHSRYHEVYVAVVGRMYIALKDARRESPTFRRTMTAWIDQGESYLAVVVPAGVLHGVYFQSEGILGYGLSSAWTGANEYNCAWNDPDLALDWPIETPILSERDASGGRFLDLVEALANDASGV